MPYRLQPGMNDRDLLDWVFDLSGNPQVPDRSISALSGRRTSGENPRVNRRMGSSQASADEAGE
jgi:hypothetical protein